MKFGKNLAHLSIPEWKLYNIDYNDLKSQIRDITASETPSLIQLNRLYASFLHNFDYINLFVNTKAGELSRKLAYFSDVSKSIAGPDGLPFDTSNQNLVVDKIYKFNELHYQIIMEVSSVLKKLVRFILIQKIAVKKIFKKFLKYSKFLAERSSKFVSGLKNHLNANPKSFTSIDLSYLTADLTQLVKFVKENQKYYYGILNGTKHVLDYHGEDLDSLNFDTTYLLKKNFQLDFLVPNDPNTTNDLLINLDIHINLKSTNSCNISFIYLVNKSLLSANHYPSYILSHEGQPFSVLIAYTGGLRKYSYCILLNEIVSLLLVYLTSPSESTESKLKGLLKPVLTPLTKITLDRIVNDQLKPEAKLVCRRTRYIVSKNEEDGQDGGKKEYQDDYLIMFDQGIFTSNDPEKMDFSFDTKKYDVFPFNHMSIGSNDSNLYNFDTNLQSSIVDNHLRTGYRDTYLNKLPYKVQLLIKNNSLNIFKNLSFMEYMKLCYFNILPSPEYTNNHFSILLKLNLFKNLENVSQVSSQKNLDDEFLENKSSQYIKRQMSLKSISSHFDSIIPNMQKNHLSVGSNESHRGSIFTQAEVSDHLSFFDYTPPNADINKEDELSDDYLVYLKVNEMFSRPTFLNKVVIACIRAKTTINSLFEHHKPYPLKENQDLEYNYDSINEDDSYGNSKVNDFEIQYGMDHDNIIAFFYFTLLFLSLFISGIALGIIYILRIEQENAQFSFFDNMWLFFVLTVGLLLSLLLSMTSILMNYQRLSHSPKSHTTVLWFGLVLDVVAVIWSFAVFLQP